MFHLANCISMGYGSSSFIYGSESGLQACHSTGAATMASVGLAQARPNYIYRRYGSLIVHALEYRV